ncbi:MAG: DNA polymerase IV [Clostridia bacterium]|nr:DNA polymerase IV [Clostridia bacterium]
MAENSLRRIIHIDMDAFYAAVEQRDNPQLRGKPVIIGGRTDSRGVVSTASYEARRYGVRSAMPMAQAYRLCPQGIYLPGDHRKYRAVSGQIGAIYREYTPLVEPLALDEAFLDVTGCEKLFGTAEEIGRKMKERISKEVGLTASVGVAHNKFLAKLASDIKKPNGFVIVGPEEVREFLSGLPVGRLWGVGEKTAALLQGWGIKNIGQVARLPMEVLEEKLGAWGRQLYFLARGIDDRPVIPDHQVKSVGHETTFDLDVQDKELLLTTLLDLTLEVGRRLRKKGLVGRTVTLKLRYSDFKTITRAATLEEATDLDNRIYYTAAELLEREDTGQAVRLLGVTVSKLCSGDEGQISLFNQGREKEEKLTGAVDGILDKFGDGAITRARLLK